MNHDARRRLLLSMTTWQTFSMSLRYLNMYSLQKPLNYPNGIRTIFLSLLYLFRHDTCLPFGFYRSNFEIMDVLFYVKILEKKI